MASQKRTKTKYPGVYLNETTKKYDVKYNYKVYNPLKQKNDYKSKWVYNLISVTEARAELAKLQSGGIKPEDNNITLQGTLELWKIKMQANNSSPVTIRNTEQYLRMISQFIPLETRVKDITEDAYLKFCSDIRMYGYSEETLYILNATLRKLINLAYQKRLVKDNILAYADNMKTKTKETYRLVGHVEFELLNSYFENNRFVRLGVDNYPKYRLLLNLLYYTGIRIGEALALTYNDFEKFSYYKKGDETENKYLQGMRVRITKSYVSDIKLTKDPKNLKKRTIPLPPAAEELAAAALQNQIQIGGSLDEKIFNWAHSSVVTMLKNACKKIDIPACTCHDFRHTYISNLIKNGVPLPVIEKVSGDTQNTILKRYSHMFETDEFMVLSAMTNL